MFGIILANIYLPLSFYELKFPFFEFLKFIDNRKLDKSRVLLFKFYICVFKLLENWNLVVMWTNNK